MFKFYCVICFNNRHFWRCLLLHTKRRLFKNLESLTLFSNRLRIYTNIDTIVNSFYYDMQMMFFILAL